MTDTRMRAYRIVSALAGAMVVTAAVAVVHDTKQAATADEGCDVKVNVALPQRPAQVKLRVSNGTRTAGLAERVSADFENRGFVTQSPAKSKSKVDQVAVIEYGPKSVGAAQWIRAFFLGEADARFSAARTTDVVDVEIGTRYRQLATQTEVNQSLAQLGEPVPPPGTCA
ncbi:LytR C-terminal domain-containing protein [Actinoplanes ianthinogenes]|nr:LytR C-terminal domain-containing protein [Actinoplanes ianthinogenes]